jgi:hypothetical protein
LDEKFEKSRLMVEEIKVNNVIHSALKRKKQEEIKIQKEQRSLRINDTLENFSRLERKIVFSYFKVKMGRIMKAR